jgi:hypothetical protein
MPGHDPVPVACMLPAADLGGRLREWRSVTAGALRARTAVPDGARLEFRPDPQVARRLLDLVLAERSCCAWASWTLHSTAEATVVEVTAAGRAAEVRALLEVTP